MEIYRFVSYKTVLEQAKDKFSFLKETISEIQAKQWMAQLMRICQVYHALQDNVEFLPVAGGRTKLPDNFTVLVSVARSCEEDVTAAECNPGGVVPMRWDTSDANTHVHFVPIDFYVGGASSYQIKDGYIFTNFDAGVIRVAYRRMPETKDGDPMVPDEGSWIQAAIYDLAANVAENLYMQDKLDARKMDFINTKRNRYVAQAITKAKMLNRAQRETFKDNWIKSIKNLYPEDTQMQDLASREYRKWHGSYNSRR